MRVFKCDYIDKKSLGGSSELASQPTANVHRDD